MTLIVLAGAIVASFAYLALSFDELLTADAARTMGQFLLSFFPPDFSGGFLAKTGAAALQTLAVSAVGTLLATIAGLFLALPASGRFGVTTGVLTRCLLNFLRSVPELVWAALMVLAAGLGPFAGVLALAAHTTGVLGRLFAESLQNTPVAPTQALLESGSSQGIAFLYGTLPGVSSQLVSYALYRWEMNIRMAAILGFVGAGGLGQMLYYELSLFHQAQASTVILVMLALSMLVDAVSASLRARLAPVMGK
jgi:phosphonate transport system permease protein